MIKLSVNINKIATVRNSRGGGVPSVVEAARVCLQAGAPGVTVHPRADARHITTQDVHDVAALLAAWPSAPEYNIEGDPRRELLELVHEVHPTQCTLVPVTPGEITSQAGWRRESAGNLPQVVGELRAAGIRVSLFVDPVADAVRWAAGTGADRIELYTEPFARAYEAGDGEAAFGVYADTAELAHSLGLGINAGHDLDLENLTLFRRLPHLDEVSIGHALVSRAIFEGLDRTVREYLDLLAR